MRLTEALAVKNGEDLTDYVFTHLTKAEVKAIKKLRRRKPDKPTLFVGLS